MAEPVARITALATATPDHDIHSAFLDWAEARLPAPEARLFNRMAARSGIANRWSVLPPTVAGGSPVAPGGFYDGEPLPGTGARMALYAKLAPALALNAIAKLDFDPTTITHVIVASCTGFTAPGVDQIIAAKLGLNPRVERLLIGFMGCYAAVTALRTARHIIRSEPDACVLVVTVELSTLHLQPATTLEPMLAMLHFGDGAAAALVTGRGAGLALDAGFTATLPESADLIQWHIGDTGFAMHLSGEVPRRISEALSSGALNGFLPDAPDGWAVHAGGRTILDAVETGLALPAAALAPSRTVLAEAGNMSSSTLMFALAHFMANPPDRGVAMAFGPGLACEALRFSGTL